jgi:hypothetical protein
MNDLPSNGVRMTKPPPGKGTIALHVLVFALVGGWLAYGVFDSWYWQSVEQNWKSTDGTIATAYVRRAVSRRPSWETGWSYSYSVNGQKYEAESTALNHAYLVYVFPSRQRAEGKEYSRPAGSFVTVYYDPADPQHSVLDFPLDSSEMWPIELVMLGLSALSMSVAVFGAYALVKSR